MKEVEETKGYASIQVQDSSGIWRSVSMTNNNTQYIRRAMGSVQNQYPKYRVRAVDTRGKVLDILTK